MEGCNQTRIEEQWSESGASCIGELHRTVKDGTISCKLHATKTPREVKSSKSKECKYELDRKQPNINIFEHITLNNTKVYSKTSQMCKSQTKRLLQLPLYAI